MGRPLKRRWRSDDLWPHTQRVRRCRASSCESRRTGERTRRVWQRVLAVCSLVKKAALYRERPSTCSRQGVKRESFCRMIAVIALRGKPCGWRRVGGGEWHVDTPYRHVPGSQGASRMIAEARTWRQQRQQQERRRCAARHKTIETLGEDVAKRRREACSTLHRASHGGEPATKVAVETAQAIPCRESDGGYIDSNAAPRQFVFPNADRGRGTGGAQAGADVCRCAAHL